MGRHRRKRVSTAAPVAAAVSTTDAHKSYNRARMFVLIFAIVAAAAVVTAILVSVIGSVIRSERIDYMKDDLSKYIYISPEDYKSYNVLAKVDPVDELAVEDSIMQMLYMYRDRTLAFGGQWLVNLPKNAAGEVVRKLAVGDAVEYRYRAYMLREDGSRDDLGEGFCNFGSENPAGLDIGEGTTYLGFEYGMIGKDPAEYSRFEAVADRPIAEGDFIKLTYSKVTPNSHQEKTTEYISVKAEDCDPIYGEGFAEFLIGRSLGETDDYFIVTEDDGRKISYLGIKVESIYDVGDNPLTIEARTSVHEAEEKLAGKTIYFDVYIERMKLLENPPVLDPMFITEKLKLSAAELEKYEGDTPDEKFRSYVVKGIEDSAKAELADVIEDAMWEHYRKTVKIKRLPEGDVLDYYNGYVEELTAQYNAAADNYNSLAEYAMLHLELDRDDNWLDHMRELAENRVTEKIIFYYIIRNEKITPNNKEYRELYDKIVEEHLSSFLSQIGCTRDKYDTEDDYNKAVARYKETMLAAYGEEYFDENVIFMHAIDTLRGYANIIYYK